MKQPIPPRLIETIDKLLANPNFGITVSDKEKMIKVTPFSTNEKIVSDYGGIQQFLEMLHEKGHRSIRVVEGLKNGTSSKPIDNGTYDLNFGNPEEKQAPDEMAFKPEFTEVQPINEQVMLHGPIPQALNAVQFYNAMDYDRVKREMDRLQILTDSQKETIEKMKEEKIKTEFSEAKARSTNDLLLGMVPHFAPIIAAKFAPAQAATTVASDVMGMAAPNVSATKQQAIAILMTLSDDQVYNMGLIMQNLSGNEALETDVATVIEKYNLDKD